MVVLAITKIKIDRSFPQAQVLLNDFHNPCRLDFGSKSGENFIYVRFCIPSRQKLEVLRFF